MDSSPQPVGIDHPTVVPVNFDPDRNGEADDGDADRVR